MSIPVNDEFYGYVECWPAKKLRCICSTPGLEVGRLYWAEMETATHYAIQMVRIPRSRARPVTDQLVTYHKDSFQEVA